MFHKPNQPRLRSFSGPTVALLWEQWRLFLPFLAGAVFMAAAGTAGLYINMRQNMVLKTDALFLSDFVRRLCSVFLPALFCANFSGGVSFPQRLYRLPVTTRRMVLYLAVSRLAFLLLTLLILLGFRMLLFGAPDWDTELRMSVLSVAALAAGLALSWSLGAFRDWPAIVGQMAIIGLAWSLCDILGNPGVRAFLGPDILWPVAGLWAVFWTLLFFAGPDRARSGVSLLRRSRRGARSSTQVRTVPGGPIRLKRFSSPFEAQAWYERRTRGYAGLVYPLLFTVFVALCVADLRLLDWISFVPVFSLTVGVAAAAAAACFVVAACRRLVEAYRVRTGRFRFLAAKPISTQELARVRFHALCRGMEAAILFAAGLVAFLWLLPPMPLLLTPSLWPPWLADAYQSLNGTAITWLLLWLVVLWLCASLTALSTPKVLGILLAWPLLRLGTTYAPVDRLMSHGGDETVIALTGLLLAAHVAGMFFRALHRGLLSPVTVLLCAVAYAVLAQFLTPYLVGLVLWDGHPLTPMQYMAWTMETFGAIALTVAPFAALPLQFDRWRHGGK